MGIVLAQNFWVTIRDGPSQMAFELLEEALFLAINLTSTRVMLSLSEVVTMDRADFSRYTSAIGYGIWD